MYIYLVIKTTGYACMYVFNIVIFASLLVCLRPVTLHFNSIHNVHINISFEVKRLLLWTFDML